MPSLREIEKTLATLWLDGEAREWLLSKRTKPMPATLKDAPEEVLRAVDRKGVALYGKLIHFGHHDVMESIYPYCSKLLGKKWSSIVDDYLLKFPPEHHNFNRLCYRFSEYLNVFGAQHLEKYPFLVELADYEWIELEKIEEETEILQFEHEPLSNPEQIAALHPVVNPTLTVRHYQFDILDIADDVENDRKLSKKIKPDPIDVAIYRHPLSHRCRFLEIGSATAQILEMARSPITYQALIPIVVSLTPELSAQESVAQFLEMVEELQELKVFVGSK